MLTALQDRSRRRLIAGSLSTLVVSAVVLAAVLGSSSTATSAEPALGKRDAQFWQQLVQNF
ncbi:MAG TPA: hypothetical protein VK926_05025, partial [Gaiellaceae bacterium]|nr:hypothetical protein [Gaiellaceae bacterium]